MFLYSLLAQADLNPLFSQYYEYQSNKSKQFLDQMYERGVMNANSHAFAVRRLDLVKQSANLFFASSRVEEMSAQSIQRDRTEILSEDQLKVLTNKYKGIFSPKYFKISLATNQIFFNQAVVFNHESMHAYQYLFRLPVDFIFLVKSGYSPLQAINILSFHYETEAHWYVHQFTPPQAWNEYLDQISKQDKKHHEAKFHFGTMTFGVFNYLSNKMSSAQIASVDLPDANWNPLRAPPAYVARFYSFPVLYDGIKKPFLLDEADLRYHYKFFLAVKQAYNQFKSDEDEIVLKKGFQKNLLKPLEENIANFLLNLSPEETTWIVQSWKNLFEAVNDQPVSSVRMKDYFIAKADDSERIQKLSAVFQSGLDQYQQALSQYQSVHQKKPLLQMEVDLANPNDL